MEIMYVPVLHSHRRVDSIYFFPRTSYKSRSDINRGVNAQYQPLFVIHIDLSTWNEPIKRIVESFYLVLINSMILNIADIKILVGPTEVKLGVIA